nr:immunoglobulin heavy chain junction region [Macaca mulatta]MOY18148.1 immunoglobulin heavy chain junction region [Macaca mulatta]MOY18234.1 immunoglobulin heavy chain junction region [Macaca mulatta]MOY18455.1 immunoglobulin heavy chain junction region [Macaca mulatta]MOY18781.1 immunoglobulin heavy chain junction region [Macaca mulatta]
CTGFVLTDPYGWDSW